MPARDLMLIAYYCRAVNLQYFLSSNVIKVISNIVSILLDITMQNVFAYHCLDREFANCSIICDCHHQHHIAKKYLTQIITMVYQCICNLSTCHHRQDITIFIGPRTFFSCLQTGCEVIVMWQQRGHKISTAPHGPNSFQSVCKLTRWAEKNLKCGSFEVVFV